MDVSRVEIPEDLVGIRAYVRWENAGMPEDTSPEWQATEYAQARLDLQTEVAAGVTLNDIRRRYNQPVVPGDDEPVVIDFATHTSTQNNVVQIHTEPDAKSDADRAARDDAARAAAAAEADLAARVAAAAAATPPPPVENPPSSARAEPEPFAPSIEIATSSAPAETQTPPEKKREPKRETAQKALSLADVEIPKDLVDIRAYVRWEDAGKPEDSPPEWQVTENAMARLDLQIEVLQGVTLNDIRRRYNQEPVAGDDKNAYEGMDVSEALARAKKNLANNVVEAPPRGGEGKEKRSAEPEEWIEPPPEEVGQYLETHERDARALMAGPECALDSSAAPPPKKESVSFVSRWADVDSDPAAPVVPAGGTCELVRRRVYPLQGDGELLVQMYEASAPGAATTRRVVFTTDAADALVLHWGVSRDEPDQWILPSEAVWPRGTAPVSEISVETPLVPGEACLDADGECATVQTLTVDLPGAGADELTGVQFVLRDAAGDRWYKDSNNGSSNFRANFVSKGASESGDELLDAIVRAEAGGGWWTLMHRFNLASSLLEEKCSPANERNRVAAYHAASKAYVWLRYSASRKLTWQRNYNVKPRELSAAQSKLTRVVAGLYCAAPHLRDTARLMLGTVGKGGGGGDGQAIRDEILNIMHRNGIGENKKYWMEQWHQKLHNNTTPDDITICEAYIAFLKANGDLGEYWRVLNEGGIDRAQLESYERPVVTEPITHGAEKKVALIKDFNNYLAILKRVHSGADLVECIRACAKGLGGVSPALNYVRVAQRGGGDPNQLLSACVEARHQLRDAGLKEASDEEWTRQLLYLDLAVDDVARRAVERAGECKYNLDDQMRCAGLVLENLALSLPSSNQDVVLSLQDWRLAVKARQEGDSQWALRAKAAMDRARLAIARHADILAEEMQPAAKYIGEACDIEQWSVDLFSEEVIRGGPAFALSLALTRLDPLLRAEADMGAWQIISPKSVVGYVMHVDDLHKVMNDVFDRPTILVADKVGGDEEFPAGAVAVLTTCSVDVLSHTAVRARNGGALFATCYEPELLAQLAGMDGAAAAVDVAGDSVAWRASDAAAVAAANGADDAAGAAGAAPKAKLALEKVPFCGSYTVPLSRFDKGVVGAKARNTKALNESLGGGRIPSWIKLPKSMVIPFGTMEHVLDDPANAAVKAKMQALERAVDDSSEQALEASLRACRECVLELVPPAGCMDAIQAEMLAAGIAPPETPERWEMAWRALTKVWASKWNDRAFVSLRNVGIDHADLRMSVLVQPVVDADYAFVIHTANPSTGDATELYAEVVAGLGEVLVGNYPGRALSFAMKKATPAEAAAGTAYVAPGALPKVIGFPSKSVALRIPRSTLIFRSDSNGEDLEGYAGAGLYESVPMDEEDESFADYATDPLVRDEEFRDQILLAITECGVAIEAALGGVPQDIEGVVKDGEIYVVQTRPQV
jgi:alpha-glucan,water dikinase